MARVLTRSGGIAVLLGSLDPLEGSVLVLPGSGLLALGSYLRRDDRRAIAYRTWSFVLVAIGVATMFGLSALGGVGGSSGHSAWWALLIAPYAIGWVIDVCGPGSPRWLSGAGVAIGVWYLAISTVARPRSYTPVIVMAVFGAATILGCSVRLWRVPRGAT